MDKNGAVQAAQERKYIIWNTTFPPMLDARTDSPDDLLLWARWSALTSSVSGSCYYKYHICTSLEPTSPFPSKTVKCWLTVAVRLNWSSGRRSLWEVTSEKYGLTPKIMWRSSLKYSRNGFSYPCSVLYMPLIICSWANECCILFLFNSSYTVLPLQILTRAAIVH